MSRDALFVVLTLWARGDRYRIERWDCPVVDSRIPIRTSSSSR